MCVSNGGGGGGGVNDVMVEWLVGYLVLTSCQSVKPQGAIETQKLGSLLCMSCHCALVCELGTQRWHPYASLTTLWCSPLKKGQGVNGATVY